MGTTGPRGVGLVYWPALEALVSPGAGLVDVIEIEPQSYWHEVGGAGGEISPKNDVFARLAALPQPKIIHSVGCALGGVVRPPPIQVEQLRSLVSQIDARWVSEHLAFNRALPDPSMLEHSGSDSLFSMFLLPPRQTLDGVRVAVESIRAFAARFPVPVIVETGVNYLKPRADEIPDGEFVARVVEAADCGILLDLHNALANERNGRQPLLDFVAALPRERVLEIHLAGGFEQRGYWLDAHSDVCEPLLIERLQEVLPLLPNARVLTFEIFPTFIARAGLDAIARQLEVLGKIWGDRREPTEGVAARGSDPAPARPLDLHRGDGEREVAAWESALTSLAVDGHLRGEGFADLEADPGVELLHGLIGSFRRGMLAQGLPMTLRLLLLQLGDRQVASLFEAFWKESSPEPFIGSEARRFADFLRAHALDVPHLHDVLAVELASLFARVDGVGSTVRIEVEPLSLFRALGEGRLPEHLETGRYEVEVRPEDVPESPGWGWSTS